MKFTVTKAGAKALTLFLFISFTGGCSTHTDFDWNNRDGLNATSMHGVALVNYSLIDKRSLKSVTSLPGDHTLRPEDYILGDKNYVFGDGQQDIAFFHSPDDVESSEDFLRQLCCETASDETVRQALNETLSWTLDLFDNPHPVNIEVALVPSEYGYEYATVYPIKNGIWTARFGHWFNKKSVSKSTANISNTLAHELSHLLSEAKGKARKNSLSDEVTAMLVGTSAEAAINDDILQDPISIKADEFGMEWFRNSDNYPESIKALRTNEDALIAGMIVRVAIEKILVQAEMTGESPVALVREYTERIVRENHDFKVSMGLEF